MPRTPCKTCPFRSDRVFPLHPERLDSIIDSLKGDGFFPCHKTVNDSVEPPDTSKAVACMGAALFMDEALRTDGGCLGNFSFRLAAMRGDFTVEDLDQPFPVYESVEQFRAALIAFHASRRA